MGPSWEGDPPEPIRFQHESGDRPSGNSIERAAGALVTLADP